LTYFCYNISNPAILVDSGTNILPGSLISCRPLGWHCGHPLRLLSGRIL